MTAYYNEFDPAAAHILRHMIAESVIAPGDVDERSIKDVNADDLKGYTQCHFFAGGGFWSVAARLAGWPDDEPIWTGSCPCQPFSAAGKGQGADDPRHLWPDFHRLIRAGRPAVVMGEQVAGKAGYGWFDGVRADLAGEGYASRATDFPACSVDAPHQRNRLYWCAVNGRLANDYGIGSPKIAGDTGEISSVSKAECEPEHDAALSWRGDDPSVRHMADTGQGELVDPSGFRWGEGRAEPEFRGRGSTSTGADASGVTQGDTFVSGLEGYAGHGDGSGRQESNRPVAAADERELANRDSHRCDKPRVSARQERQYIPDSAGDYESLYADADRCGRARRTEGAQRFESERTAIERPLSRNGTYWSDAEWIECHDGKARRAQPGICFLVDGLPGRVDLWRVGGNAIVPQAAQEVIAAFIDAYGLPSTWRDAA